MNRFARGKSLSHFVFCSPSSRKDHFFIHSVTSIQRPIFYSTKTVDAPKTQQSSKPRTHKSSESYLSFSQKVKKQAEDLSVRPRPREIPYQAKVANLVNIIGHVKAPVKFEVDSDGKQLAATIISHEQEGGKNSLLIPVVFEDVLAHVVACHVKESDCVFVSGQLSVDPMRIVLRENLGRLHVIVDNLNFVEGLKRTGSAFAWKKKGGITSDVEIDKPIIPVPMNVEEVKIYSDYGNDNVVKESNMEKGNEPSKETFSKKNNGDSWRDVIINPLQWWDYREHKSNGLVKEKFPDFKHKVSGDSLWIGSAPEWVLAELGKLEFDVKPLYGKKQPISEKKQPAGPGIGAGERRIDDKGDDSWKNLVDNPDKWWDNRSQKRNPKSPDFKHKETGEVLWLNRSPAWALSELPPLREN